MANDGFISQQAIARTLGRYQVIKRIGRGGMADVWLCEDPRLHRQVAIKTLPAHAPDDVAFTRRFEVEAQAAAALTHPHIVSVHDYGEHSLPNGQVITYIVMPYLPGGSLADRIEALTAAKQHMPIEEALTYLAQAADAIDYAHQQGVVHRDIKPGNMLLRDANWLLLSDFGIAHLLSGNDAEVHTGAGFGTPEYMAPEQARGRDVPSSDIYSLAVIAFQLFTGRLPFIAETTYALSVQHILTPPPSPRQFNPQLPVQLEQAILHALAKKPEERPGSAQVFFAELIRAYPGLAPRFTSEAPLPASSHTPHTLPPLNENASLSRDQHSTITQSRLRFSGFLPASDKPITRRTALAGGGIAALLLAGGGSAWFLTHQSKPTPKPPVQAPTPPARPNPNGPNLVIRDINIDTISGLAWSPQGNFLTTMPGTSDTIYTWDIEHMRANATPQPGAKLNLKYGSKTLAWSPDGSILALGNTNEETLSDFHTMSLDLYTRDFSGRAPGFQKPIFAKGAGTLNGLTWTRQKYLFSVSYIADAEDYQHFYLWGLDCNKPGQTTMNATKIKAYIGGGISPANTLVKASPDGQKIAIACEGGILVGTASMNGGLPTWQDAPGQLPLPQDQNFQDLLTVSWSPDGNKVAGYYSSNTTALAVWDVGKGTKQTALTTTLSNKITTLAYGTNGKTPLIATGTPDGQIQLWDTNHFDQPVATLSSDVKKAVQALAWSADYKWLAASYNDDYATTHIWKMQGRTF
ncbi:serine/threonine-protein kinase [Ktedonobacter racemifer]|uniref:non-specific serine/threonine protein kinase n=1 Tax=Ktedonobacter racemifer DSM 44963 TaxID=485913 RepID=D6U6Y7_KTERA|nr:serine/threonine-protein kinase [Ktedonobacter racemifer]EFH80748.1 serine/threonine protein kinase with WD40 repeats [Ktedonobacter racemifer DSM 44963]